ncbi:Fic/DOC family protein [Paenibacillus jiagnxiensis]|uniref:Fic/DOC family protein n=1 Tax=Paenibacillus jiagnxiensis TaxID=3228926 RepID=UPI0033A84D9E
MMQSIYTYPGTDVLKNKPGIQDQEKLSLFEDIVSSRRIAQMYLKPMRGKLDLGHLQNIHYHVFQDVYPFAGQLRKENIAKDTFSFADSRFIEDAGRELFSGLAKENFLLNTPADQFSDRAAHYMAEINVLHPFREGNGRTQREFIRQLAAHSGYEVDWTRVDKDIALRASIRSVADTKELSKVIGDSLVNHIPDQAIRERYLRAGDRDRSR